MPGKFEIKKSADGQFMFNLKSGNHEVILTSELYKEKRSAISGIASVRANALDPVRYERKTAKNGSPFFVLKAGNGEVIGKSEMYSSATAMEGGIESVKKNALAATVQDLTAN